MIRLSNIHKTYGSEGSPNPVLRGVNLDVAPGEMVALMGVSGSGKSTLLNIIGAMDQDYTGDVLVAGQSLRGLGDDALSAFRNRTVSFVFQQFHLLPHLRVIDNVAMPGWFDPATGPEACLARAQELLERVGLGGKLRERPGHLSGGEKQRVAIARALLHHPRVLLADEPTGALDTQNGERILSLLEQLNQSEDLTVVLVTHEREVARRAQRIVTIRDGRIAPDGHGKP